jgi:hypothetical protein
VRCVFPVEPWRFDARQAAQQTLLFYPTSVGASFEENLADVAAQVGRPMTFLRKFTIPDKLRPEILQDLTSMNVTAASLFPGMDGFARSMYSYLTIEPSERTSLRLAIQSRF